MNYGKALKIARAIAGMEQKDLAKEARLDPSHISLIERGARRPSVGAIHKLCQALEIPEPLFAMLASERSDLRGVGEKDFERIGTYLARFLMQHADTAKSRRRRRSNAP